jgi:hypothetical protein
MLFDGGISRTAVALWQVVCCLVVAALISGLLLAVDDCASNSYFLKELRRITFKLQC